MTDSAPYEHDFYKDRHQRTLYAAERLLELVAEIVPRIASAADIGCGVGTWLSVLQARGVGTLQGYDGPWVDTDLLEIPRQCFASRDLTQVIDPPARKFDLALSLEVAEHLPATSAGDFVTTLTNQSDFILFSAAIPHQGGRHHVNEQWPEYWTALFGERGYVGLDVLRKAVWGDEKIQRWYRQNALLFVARQRLGDLNLRQDYTELEPLPLVHPRSFEDRIARYEQEIANMKTLKGAWKLFRRALKQSAAGPR